MQNTQEQIQKLAATVGRLEAGNLQEFQKEILQQLYSIRQSLVEDISKSLKQSPGQVDDAKDKEIKRLEDENRKQAYRIQHLQETLSKDCETRVMIWYYLDIHKNRGWKMLYFNKDMSVIEGQHQRSPPMFRTRNVKHTNVSTPFLKYRPTASFSDWNKVRFDGVQIQEKYNTKDPLRIPIPPFFNIPGHQDASIRPMNFENEDVSGIYITSQPVKQLTMPVQFNKKIKQLAIIRDAMKRGKHLKSQARCDYSLGVMYENIGKNQIAADHYLKFLQMAVHFKDQKSMELVLNSLGILDMKFHRFPTSIQYHQKQVDISSDVNKFIGYINIAKCYDHLGELQKALKNASLALQIAKNEQNQSRLNFVEQLVIGFKERSPGVTKNQTEQIQNYYSRETSLKRKQLPHKLVVPHMKLAGISLDKKQYTASGVQYAKSIQFAQMNASPKSRSVNKQLIQAIRLGYSISRAEDNMQSYLDNFKDSLTTQENIRLSIIDPL